jgi:glutaconate CoA-transferase, subunit A
MAEIVSLADGVATVVRNGDTVAMEGFTHLIPIAAGHEVIRQGRRDLTLVRMTPDVIYDQLIGAGCGRRLVFSWGGNPGGGALHRFRDAVQQGWPVPLAVEEHSHAGMANRYVASASGLPFAVLRGYAGTDLPSQTDSVRPIVCPFTGEVLTAVPALRPDAAVVHAQRADRAGNVRVWGIIGVHKEAVLASSRSLVTVEEIVEELDPRPGAVVLPGWAVGYVAEVPGGAHPSYAHGYYERDNAWYQPGMRSAATATASSSGWRTTSWPPVPGVDDDLDGGGDDDGRRRACAPRWHDLLCRHWPAEHGRQPGPGCPCAGASADP